MPRPNIGIVRRVSAAHLLPWWTRQRALLTSDYGAVRVVWEGRVMHDTQCGGALTTMGRVALGGGRLEP